MAKLSELAAQGALRVRKSTWPADNWLELLPGKTYEQGTECKGLMWKPGYFTQPSLVQVIGDHDSDWDVWEQPPGYIEP